MKRAERDVRSDGEPPTKRRRLDEGYTSSSSSVSTQDLVDALTGADVQRTESSHESRSNRNVPLRDLSRSQRSSRRASSSVRSSRNISRSRSDSDNRDAPLEQRDLDGNLRVNARNGDKSAYRSSQSGSRDHSASEQRNLQHADSSGESSHSSLRNLNKTSPVLSRPRQRRARKSVTDVTQIAEDSQSSRSSSSDTQYTSAQEEPARFRSASREAPLYPRLSPRSEPPREEGSLYPRISPISLSTSQSPSSPPASAGGQADSHKFSPTLPSTGGRSPGRRNDGSSLKPSSTGGHSHAAPGRTARKKEQIYDTDSDEEPITAAPPPKTRVVLTAANPFTNRRVRKVVSEPVTKPAHSTKINGHTRRVSVDVNAQRVRNNVHRMNDADVRGETEEVEETEEEEESRQPAGKEDVQPLRELELVVDEEDNQPRLPASVKGKWRADAHPPPPPRVSPPPLRRKSSASQPKRARSQPRDALSPFAAPHPLFVRSSEARDLGATIFALPAVPQSSPSPQRDSAHEAEDTPTTRHLNPRARNLLASSRSTHKRRETFGGFTPTSTTTPSQTHTMRRMSDNHGFSPSIVRGVVDGVGNDLALADAVLGRMRAGAERAALETLGQIFVDEEVALDYDVPSVDFDALERRRRRSSITPVKVERYWDEDLEEEEQKEEENEEEKWTKEEDALILSGSPLKALKAIDARRGPGAVARRLGALFSQG
ncbi:hypothetical protein EXIGLDRAFT_752928 [Exidia glandulosa HHB12029]|uniref:Uncharacterized protein n=1 Tax=Exidia glandulosa HHB12029 TaxID=1314781 RepID=A0A165E7J0_EXIGL|nr:hypothetical protein EXIGLDRAFT_752928 [Exidia glandulosa HHB12029]